MFAQFSVYILSKKLQHCPSITVTCPTVRVGSHQNTGFNGQFLQESTVLVRILLVEGDESFVAVFSEVFTLSSDGKLSEQKSLARVAINSRASVPESLDQC